MKPKDIFGLSLRLLGLVFFYRGVFMLPVAVVTGWMFLHAALFFALGWWLVGGAKLLLNRAYPEAPETSIPPASPAEVPPRRPN